MGMVIAEFYTPEFYRAFFKTLAKVAMLGRGEPLDTFGFPVVSNLCVWTLPFRDLDINRDWRKLSRKGPGPLGRFVVSFYFDDVNLTEQCTPYIFCCTPRWNVWNKLYCAAFVVVVASWIFKFDRRRHCIPFNRKKEYILLSITARLIEKYSFQKPFEEKKPDTTMVLPI